MPHVTLNKLKYANRSTIDSMLNALKDKKPKNFEGWTILELRPIIKDGTTLERAVKALEAFRAGKVDRWDTGCEIAVCLGIHVIREDTI